MPGPNVRFLVNWTVCGEWCTQNLSLCSLVCEAAHIGGGGGMGRADPLAPLRPSIYGGRLGSKRAHNKCSHEHLGIR